MYRRDQATLLLGGCTFDQAQLTLRDASGRTVPLRSQSMRVLGELARARGELVTRDDLIDAVWPGVAVTDDSLVQCIKDIRSALSDPGRQIVETVVGRGYKLNARTAAEASGSLPKLFIERFDASAGAPEAVELGEALFEELLVRLTPRAGATVVTDPAHRPEAGYVISGRASVRGQKARLFVRINRGAGGGEIHAVTEEASDDAIWDLPGRVADSVVAQLRIHMIMGDGAEFVDRDNSELSPQELKAKAAWHMSRYRRENWYAATAALEAAVERAPDDPVAVAMLAHMAIQMILHIPFDELPPVDRAMALAERAVELGQDIDWVLRTRGTIRLWRLGDHEGACLDCYRALEINPAFHLAHLTIASSDILTGAFDAGAQRLREMMRRAPVDSQNPYYFALIALAEFLAGRKDAALRAAREGHERNPLGSWNALVYAAVAADDRDLTDSDGFRRMLGRIDLPAAHFLDLPFTDPRHGKLLAARAEAAGA